MKVLHVIMHGHKIGGQVVASQIIDYLQAHGDTPCVLSPSPGPFTEMLLKQGVQIFFKPLKKTYHFHDALWIARLIKQKKIDIVHTHSLGAGNILSRFGAFFSRRPVISHVHTQNNYNRNKLIRAYQVRLENASLKVSAKIIAVSSETKNQLIAQGISPEKVEVIPNGVEIPTPAPEAKVSILKELSLPPETRLIACVGRLCKTKGQHLLIEALSRLLQSFPQAVVLFVGEDLQENGNYKNQLLAQSRNLGVHQNAIFLGQRNDVIRLIQGCEFLVLPSFVEGLPIAILEAMSCGKAVVATSTDGVPELVSDGKTGFLATPGNATQIFEKMLLLLQRPNLAETMGNEGRVQVQARYPLSRVLQRIMEIYYEVNFYAPNWS